MDSFNAILVDFSEYIDGTLSEDQFRVRMKKRYDEDRLAFNRDLYTKTLDLSSDSEINLKKLLNSLKIPENQHERYVDSSLTVYGLLVELNKALKGENKPLKQLVQEYKKSRWKSIASISLLFATIGSVPFYLYGLTIVQQLLAMALFIPIVGLVYTVGVGLYTLYDANVSHKKLSYQAYSDNFFTFSNVIINSLAYALIISAAATATAPVVAGLFVAAEVMNVVKEAIGLSYLYFHDRANAKKGYHLVNAHEQAREDIDFQKRKRNLWVNLVGAIALVVLVAVWVFVPGSLVVTAGIFLGIGVVYGLKKIAIDRNEKAMEAELLVQFENIESPEGLQDDASLESSAQIMSSLYNADGLQAPYVLDDLKDVEVPKMPLTRVNLKGLFGEDPNNKEPEGEHSLSAQMARKDN